MAIVHSFFKNKVLSIVIFGLLIWSFNDLRAQEHESDRYFSNIILDKNVIEKEIWNLSAVGHFKNYYSKEDGWRRSGLDINSKWEFEPWDLMAGLVTNYTFDDSIQNFLEVTPYVGVGLTNTIYKNFKLEQVLLLEYRRFYFSEIFPDSYMTRARLKLKPYYEFKKGWTVYTEYEWYIMQNKDVGIRFLNSREWSFGVTKKFEKYSIHLYYTRESFYESSISNEPDANLFNLKFTF